MNIITVTAHGAENSFVRQVQQNPMMAVQLFVMLRDLMESLSDEDDEGLLEHTEIAKRARAVIAQAVSMGAV